MANVKSPRYTNPSTFAGWATCLKCRNSFLSPNKREIRICDVCKGKKTTGSTVGAKKVRLSRRIAKSIGAD